jgi:ribosomal protein S18 acetylase RimI-like enzyme
MSEIRVVEAAGAPWADVEHALTGGGDGGSCWCQWFMMPRKDFAAATSTDLREKLRLELERAEADGTAVTAAKTVESSKPAAPTPSPGLLAYVDGEAAAWMRVGPRVSQSALRRSRVVTAGSDEPADDPDVWAITCFVVRRQFRGLGLSKRLVRAGLEHAASHGARVVEAYPFDTDEHPRAVNELYVGTVRLFRGQGFVETARPTGARVVMTHGLPVEKTERR